MSDNKKKSILLIEDDNIIADILSERLKKAGYAIKVVNNGRLGILAINTKRPDIVLLDMFLPVLDGFGVLEELKKSGFLPKLPVIIISNSGQSIEVERALKMGVRDYLVKLNFNPNDVLKKIKQVL